METVPEGGFAKRPKGLNRSHAAFDLAENHADSDKIRLYERRLWPEGEGEPS